MSDIHTENFDPERDLMLERIVDVPPELIWRGWTRPAELKKWFCPRPWQTVECDIELRPGGAFRTVMQGPNGERVDEGAGCILDVVENRRLVFTDALAPGYRPKAGGFMTATVIMQPAGQGARYIAIAAHKCTQDKKTHEDMGFHQGWNAALDQLVDLARTWTCS